MDLYKDKCTYTLGSEDGFIQGAMLVKDSKATDEDYHREMDGFGFQNWFQKSLIPNIPANCIIVMDNAPYHSMTTIPKSNWKVNDMRDWLIKKTYLFLEAVRRKIYGVSSSKRNIITATT